MSSSITPARKSFTGGRRSPSCWTSVARVEKPPGTDPPVSGQWPVLASHAQCCAAVEERLDHLDVHQMRAAAVRVVDEEDVARRDVARALDDRARGELHDAHEDGQPQLALGDDVAGVAVVDAVGTVEALGDDRREGGALEGEIHLAGHLLEAVLDDDEGDGVDRLLFDGRTATERTLDHGRESTRVNAMAARTVESST